MLLSFYYKNFHYNAHYHKKLEIGNCSNEHERYITVKIIIKCSLFKYVNLLFNDFIQDDQCNIILS